MARNTFILVIILAIFAALIVGVNIGRKVQNPPPKIITNNLPTPTPTIKINVINYTNTTCGISFSYPDTLTKMDSADGNAMFIDSKNTINSVALACQKDIPRPPLTADKIEKITIGSVSASLYHDASAKDGTPNDKLIFTHPNTKKDVYIAGYGDPLKIIISSIIIK
jgi:hypothetical protein